MDNANTPVHHEIKKKFYVALMEAIFKWDQKQFKELERQMKDNGITDQQIKNARFYNPGLFKGCVRRYIPKLIILYWRVREVYAIHGNMANSKSNKSSSMCKPG